MSQPDALTTLLDYVTDHPGTTTAQAATDLGTARSTTTKRLTALENKGLLQRTPGGRDSAVRLPDTWHPAIDTAPEPGEDDTTQTQDPDEQATDTTGTAPDSEPDHPALTPGPGGEDAPAPPTEHDDDAAQEPSKEDPWQQDAPAAPGQDPAAGLADTTEVQGEACAPGGNDPQGDALPELGHNTPDAPEEPASADGETTANPPTEDSSSDTCAAAHPAEAADTTGTAPDGEHDHPALTPGPGDAADNDSSPTSEGDDAEAAEASHKDGQSTTGDGEGHDAPRESAAQPQDEAPPAPHHDGSDAPAPLGADPTPDEEAALGAASQGDDTASTTVLEADTTDTGDAPPQGTAPAADGTQQAAPSLSVNKVSGTRRLPPGGLRDQVRAVLDADPGAALSPADIRRRLPDTSRSVGAIRNAADRLVALGEAAVACERPMRYRAT